MREITVRKPIQLLLVGIVLLYATVLLLVPLAGIVQAALEKGVPALIEALNQEDVIDAFKLTAFLAIGAVIINTIAGLAIAWVLARHHFPGKRFFDALIDTPFVFPPVVIGYVLIAMFGNEGWIPTGAIQIVFSWPAMLLVTVFVSLPFVVREVQPVLQHLTPEQEEAAYTLGARRWTTFRRIVFPEIWSGLLYGIVLTLARAMGEFGAALVAGGGIQQVTETATIYVYRALHDRNNTAAYGVSLVLAILSAAILLVMSRLRRTRIVQESK